MSAIPQIYKSIIRNSMELVSLIGATTGNQDIQFHNWEARGEENDLPRCTLLGPDGFTFEENGGLWVVRYGLTLSVVNDVNLLDETEILGLIHDRTGERSKLRLLDELTGDEVSEMYCTAWQLAAMASSPNRNYRSIGIELLRAGE
jgi:hypothetical protein